MASSTMQSGLKKRESTGTREGDQLIITPLGAGNEVGRSCVYMTFKGKTVMVCCYRIILLFLVFLFMKLILKWNYCSLLICFSMLLVV